MEEPPSPRPLERLARMRASRVEEARRQLAAAQARLDERRAERAEAKLRQREAEKRARSCLHQAVGEGSTAALEALVIGGKRLEEARARVRAAKAEVARCQELLEAERAGEKAALEMAGDRSRAVQRWKDGKEQDEIEEAFRVRPRDES